MSHDKDASLSQSETSSQAEPLLQKMAAQPDVSRGVRVSVAFMVPLVLCPVLGYAAATPFVATASQVLASPNLRGDYSVRLAILGVMTVVIAIAGVLGAMVGSNIAAAVLVMGALALLGGLWRHLSADYGQALGVYSVLLFLLALEHPMDLNGVIHMAEWIAAGGAIATILHLGMWFFRPQHALRKSVAECWVTASDLFLAMRQDATGAGTNATSDEVEKERELRAILDKTAGVLSTKATRRNKGLLSHLETVSRLAGRLAMRVIALSEALEPLLNRPDFQHHAPTFDSALNALANTSRSIAITVVSHRAENFTLAEARLRRCGHLLDVLDKQLAALPETDAFQARRLLQVIKAVMPDIRKALLETADQAETRWLFPLQLPDLSSHSMQMLTSWMNPSPEIDPVLVRFSVRMAALTMIAVALYKGLGIPRGYWIAFAIMVVLQPDYGATRKRALERILGTIAGILIGTGLLWLKMPIWMLVASGGIATFFFAFFLARNYAVAIFFVTIMLVLVTELHTPVHMDFAIGRILSNAAGSAMALAAALLFWPSWEREKFPAVMAASIRANRDYLNQVARHIASGQSFSGEAVEAKRQAERASSLAAASLQRMLAEPASRQYAAERSIALVAYNQRVTRAVTVLAATLAHGMELISMPMAPVEQLCQALESLAEAIQSDRFNQADLEPMDSHLRQAEAQLKEGFANLEIASNRGFAAAIFTQLEKISTEVKAMMLAISEVTA